ncbi:MAG: hypothetical protein AAB706_03355 [Patescibacteria group bacterium]
MVDRKQYQRIKRLYAEIPGSVISDQYYGAQHDRARQQGYRYLSAELDAPHPEVAHHLALMGAVAVASGGYLCMHVHATYVAISVAISGEPYEEDLLAEGRGAPDEVVQ